MNRSPRSIAAASSLLFLLTPAAALADHFRGAYLTWRSLGGNTVAFRTVQVWDAGDVTPLALNPGDGDVTISAPHAVIFTAIDGGGDSYTVIEYTVTHTYDAPGVYDAFLGVADHDVVCCRLGELVHLADESFRIATRVDTSEAESPRPLFPMVVKMKANCPNAVALAVADPDGVTCTLAVDGPTGAGNASGSIVPVSPNLDVLTNVGCTLSWTPGGTTPGDRYATQVVLDDGAAEVAVDFIIEIVAGQCCGNDLVEGGEVCDGTDDAACPGGCQSNCTCCGDGIANAGEICDGMDDAACTGGGSCQSNCTCCGDGIANAGETCDGADDAACFPAPGLGCAGNCLCATPASGCANVCTPSDPVCTGLENELRVVGVGQSFLSRYPADAAFVGSGPCDTLIVNDPPWGELPSFAVSPVSGSSQPAPTVGACEHDGSLSCTTCGECNAICTHDANVSCATNGDCEALSMGSQCVFGSDCLIPPNSFPVTFDATPVPGDENQTYDVTLTFTPPGFTVPGGLEYFCSFEIRVPGCGDDIADGRCTGDTNVYCNTDADCAAELAGTCFHDARCSDDGTTPCDEDADCAPAECIFTEACDGIDDDACGGDSCLPPGDLNECQCPICGDGALNAPGEECDGEDADDACPGACQLDCTCGECGDDLVNTPDETCDGLVGPCPGACIPEGFPGECTCAACGDGTVQPGLGEECEPTSDAACPGLCRPALGPAACTCIECGDDIADPGEECDGADDAACAGLCRPAGDLNACECAVCGDGDVNAPGEVCDGADAAACPGLCLPSGDPNQCKCPVCGDGDLNQGSEECDLGDDAACPGACRPDCTCPVCGDGVAEGGEQCDGADAAACPGSCRPPGDLNECACPVCGDGDVNQLVEECDGADAAMCPGACLPSCVCSSCGDGVAQPPVEECDGVDDAACPGECLPPGDPNQCACPVCGDGDVNQPGEECDGADDAACPGGCLSSCLCATCGNGVAEAPAEGCDGADDAACPGACLPPGDANECQCPVCGDGDLNQPGEECDGGDDAACPGECSSSCACAVCGNGVAETPAEECDGGDDAACPGACLPLGHEAECRCPFCGDGIVNAPGEQCDPPAEEICNNMADDDGNMLIDCDDPLCSARCEHDDSILCSVSQECRQLQPGSRCIGQPACSPTCQLSSSCEVAQTDPGKIVFHDGKPDVLSMHAQYAPQSAVDLAADGFAIQITNANGAVYGATVAGAALSPNASGKRFRYRDRNAKQSGGVFKLLIVQKDGKYAFRVRAYGDLSAATLALMTTHVVMGDDGTSISAEWSPIRNGWRLSRFDFR